MKIPTINITKLALVNYVLQLFFIRLTRCSQRVFYELSMHEVSMMQNGDVETEFEGKYYVETWYSIQGWIVPFTGWYNDFIIVHKRWFKKVGAIRISK